VNTAQEAVRARQLLLRDPFCERAVSPISSHGRQEVVQMLKMRQGPSYTLCTSMTVGVTVCITVAVYIHVACVPVCCICTHMSPILSLKLRKGLTGSVLIRLHTKVLRWRGYHWCGYQSETSGVAIMAAPLIAAVLVAACFSEFP
jgi:hypothetical protein